MPPTTPAGAATLAIIVAIYTGGAGSQAVGTTAATAGGGTTTTMAGATLSTTTASGVVTTTALCTAINAGFATLASQASIAMTNNGGDIGKTLEQLGSQENVKTLLVAMATAGAIKSMGGTAEVTGQTGSASEGFRFGQLAKDFSTNLGTSIRDSVAASLIDAGIRGKPMDEALLSDALKSAFLKTGAASGATGIGDAATGNDAVLNAYTQAAAHAVLGCAVGSAKAGGEGCAPGAVGAVVGELTAKYGRESLGMTKEDALKFAGSMSAISGLLVGGGGDNVAAVNIANTTGSNAAANNYLKHDERQALGAAQKTCYTTGDPKACGTASVLQRKDELSDRLLANAVATCKGADCNDVSNLIQRELSALGCPAPSACPDYNTLSSYWKVAQEKAQGLEPVYPESWVLDAKAVADLGRFGLRFVSGTVSNSKASLEALGQLGKTDAMLAEANFTTVPSGFNETTPFKSLFGKAPNDSTLAQHLSTGGPSTKNVYGAHSESAFHAELASIEGVLVGEPKLISPGITEYTYTTPERIATNKAPLTKTTYDTTYTDAQILDMSRRASSQVWTEIQRTGVVPTTEVTTVIDGVPFMVRVTKDKTGAVSNIYSHPGK